MTTNTLGNWIKITDKQTNVTKNPIKVTKQEFMDILKGYPEGLELTITNITKPRVSQFQEVGAIDKKMYFFIDYIFNHANKVYTVGYSYDLGYEIEDDCYYLCDKKLKKLLELVIPTLKATTNDKEVVITKSKIDSNLIGLKLMVVSEFVKYKNGTTYLAVKPIRIV